MNQSQPSPPQNTATHYSITGKDILTTQRIDKKTIITINPFPEGAYYNGITSPTTHGNGIIATLHSIRDKYLDETTTIILNTGFRDYIIGMHYDTSIPAQPTLSGTITRARLCIASIANETRYHYTMPIYAPSAEQNATVELRTNDITPILEPRRFIIINTKLTSEQYNTITSYIDDTLGELAPQNIGINTTALMPSLPLPPRASAITSIVTAAITAYNQALTHYTDMIQSRKTREKTGYGDRESLIPFPNARASRAYTTKTIALARAYIIAKDRAVHAASATHKHTRLRRSTRRNTIIAHHNPLLTFTWQRNNARASTITERNLRMPIHAPFTTIATRHDYADTRSPRHTMLIKPSRVNYGNTSYEVPYTTTTAHRGPHTIVDYDGKDYTQTYNIRLATNTHKYYNRFLHETRQLWKKASDIIPPEIRWQWKTRAFIDIYRQ